MIDKEEYEKELKEFSDLKEKLAKKERYFIDLYCEACKIMSFVLEVFSLKAEVNYSDYRETLSRFSKDGAIIHVCGFDRHKLNGTPFVDSYCREIVPFELLFDPNWEETVKNIAAMKEII